MQSSRTGSSSRPMPRATRMVEGPLARIFSFVVIPLLVIAVLLLPPINLWQTLRSYSYTGIDARGGTVQDPDGAAVTFPDEAVESSFRVQLASIPRLDFVAAKEGSDAFEASQGLSANSLKPLSPFYQLDLKGKTPDGAILTIPIPNDSQPYERLALYTWTGEGWDYLPNKVLTVDDRVEAKLAVEIVGWVVGCAGRRYGDRRPVSVVFAFVVRHDHVEPVDPTAQKHRHQDFRLVGLGCGATSQCGVDEAKAGEASAGHSRNRGRTALQKGAA